MLSADGLDPELDRRARSICHLIICGRPSAGDLPELHGDLDLADEVRRRLHACGLELHLLRGHNRWAVIGAPELRDEVPNGLAEPQLAALAHLYVQLEVAAAPDQDTPRVGVREFCQTFGASRGWTVDYVRRAIVGPLERAEYVKTVTPGQSRRAAYLVAGPRMGALDRRRIVRRLERAVDDRETEAA